MSSAKASWSNARRLSKNFEQLLEKRRGSASKFISRLRSGSLPGWSNNPLQSNQSTVSIQIGSTEDTIFEEHDGCKEFNDGNLTVPSEKREYELIPLKTGISGIDQTKCIVENPSDQKENEALGLILSALYAKVLVVMGLAFSLSEVLSSYIRQSYYDGFFLYLYFGSIFAMVYIYGNIIRRKVAKPLKYVASTIQRDSDIKSAGPVESNSDSESSVGYGGSPKTSTNDEKPRRSGGRALRNRLVALSRSVSNSSFPETSFRKRNFGSFYLRMGAVAFGVGSVIYSGLDFGQYFELKPGVECHNFMVALTPLVRMIFTFAQMCFIFLNSTLANSSARLGAQFGLMHMIGTNLCVWFDILVEETLHEILHLHQPTPSSNNTFSHFYVSNLTIASYDNSSMTDNSVHHHHHIVKRGLSKPRSYYECRKTDIMGSLVENTAPFLFPCTIEYSLICSAILYVMWKSITKRRAEIRRIRSSGYSSKSGSLEDLSGRRSHNHYSVDCAKANKGLFIGILILVMTIISLILFLVLTERPAHKAFAMLEVNVMELVLYITGTLAILIGMCQIRTLRFVNSRTNLELDNILLLVAQTGSIIYNVFTIISSHFTLASNTILELITALASLIQLIIQTIFILDSSKRVASSPDQVKRKPGREAVTFLLVINLAMWLVNTLVKSRADSQSVQLKFYGVWAWTIITRITMPLAIFYRFHSTVCLFEIWKKAFKLKSKFAGH